MQVRLCLTQYSIWSRRGGTYILHLNGCIPIESRGRVPSGRPIDTLETGEPLDSSQRVGQIDSRRIGPQVLEVVEVASLFIEYVDNHRSVVQDDPTALRVA